MGIVGSAISEGLSAQAAEAAAAHDIPDPTGRTPTALSTVFSGRTGLPGIGADPMGLTAAGIPVGMQPTFSEGPTGQGAVPTAGESGTGPAGTAGAGPAAGEGGAATGEAPHTGGYIAGDLAGPANEVLAKLREGEYVVPPGPLAEQMRAATPGLTKTGTRLLAEHEQSETTQQPDGTWVNVYGRRTPQAGQPLPKKYEFEKDIYGSVEEAVDAAERRSEKERHQEPIPEGRWYLDPKRGTPFEAGSNPEPDRAWRLAFNAEQLYEAWSRRGKDGHPLLVPASVLDRQDWPAVMERARRTQYETVHPAVALARSAPPVTEEEYREAHRAEPLETGGLGRSPRLLKIPRLMRATPIEDEPIRPYRPPLQRPFNRSAP